IRECFSALGSRPLLLSSILDIQVLYEFSAALNKVLAHFYLCTHQLAKDSVGFLGVFDFYLGKYPVGWVHSGLPKLVGIHLAQTLIPLNRHAGLFYSVFVRVDFNAFGFALFNQLVDDIVTLFISVRVLLFLAGSNGEQWRFSGIYVAVL